MGEQPKIEIPLDLPDVRVLRTRVIAKRELIIEVESTLTSTTCRRCGQTISNFCSLTLNMLGYQRFSPWQVAHH
jgi:hypothetical protein